MMNQETSEVKAVIRMARVWRKNGLLDEDWPCDKYGQKLSESLAVLAAMTGLELAEVYNTSITYAGRGRKIVLSEFLKQMQQ
jgi:hypothetical protein